MAYHLKHNPELWLRSVRVLSVDHGTKTLGLAISDEDQSVIMPIETIHRKRWGVEKQALDKIIREEQVSAILMGYPLNMDGSKGPRCQSVKDYVILMEQAWPDISFFFWDERLSTEALDESVHKSVNKDSFSAKIILEDALSWLKNNA